VKTSVVVGNPKPASRTLDAAGVLVGTLTGSDPDRVVDLASLGTGLMGRGDEGVNAAVTSVAFSDLVVLASPTFKSTNTGILKLVLDQFASGEGLKDVVAVLDVGCGADARDGSGTAAQAGAGGAGRDDTGSWAIPDRFDLHDGHPYR